MSGAVQDLDRGLVAGLNTFGKGLVQNQVNLSEGKLLLTDLRDANLADADLRRADLSGAIMSNADLRRAKL